MSTTALVVDDHAGFRTSARFLLEMEGFEVVGEAADGASAVEAVERLRPDLVLLDVQLPDAQGYDVARQIFDRGLAPRIVLISSRDESDYGDNVRTSGAVGFLNKAELSGDRLRALLETDASCS
jgi:DNA-binding NarL/FixJ family response regulator